MVEEKLLLIDLENVPTIDVKQNTAVSVVGLDEGVSYLQVDDHFFVMKMDTTLTSNIIVQEDQNGEYTVLGPIASDTPKRAKLEEPNSDRKLYVVLEEAPLELLFLKNRKPTLLSSDTNRDLLYKKNIDYAFYRPDITHQCLLTLTDSLLNKNNRLHIIIRTHKNSVIKINPKLRVPRTYARFQGLLGINILKIAQLLDKKTIKATDTNEVLMEVVKGDVMNGDTLNKVNTIEYFKQKEVSVVGSGYVVVLGAIASGKDEFRIRTSDVDESISLSEYGLSASYCCGKIVNALEYVWNIE